MCARVASAGVPGPSVSPWALRGTHPINPTAQYGPPLPNPPHLSQPSPPPPPRLPHFSSTSAQPLYTVTFRVTYRRPTSLLPAAPLSRWQHRHRATVCVLRQGARFDPDLPQTIRLEFAKSNTKVSKPKQQVSAAAPHPALMHPAFSHGRKYPAHRDSPGLTGTHRDSQRLTEAHN